MRQHGWLGPLCLLSTIPWGVVSAEEATIGSSVLNKHIMDSVEMIRSVTYHRVDNKPLRADIYRPRQRKGPIPGILMVHGGAWFAGDKIQIHRHASYAASRGYAVMAINYRLAPIHKFPAQLEDCREALRWLGQHAGEYDIDRERMAAYGYSAGGHLVSLLGMTAGDRSAGERDGQTIAAPVRLRAIVAGGAPCSLDWIPKDSRVLAFWLGGSREELPEVYLQASPVSHVDSDDPPVFLFHGEADQIVPISSSRSMNSRLKAAGVPTTLHIVPGARHFQAFLDEESRRAAVDFLDKVLKHSAT